MTKWLAAAVGIQLVAAVAVVGIAGLPGCSPDYGLERPTRLCVDLPDVAAMDADAEERRIRQLDPVLRAQGYVWYQTTTSSYGKVRHDWYTAEPKRGRPFNHVAASHYRSDPSRFGVDCRLRIAVYADFRRPHAALEWAAFFALRNRALPASFPDSPIRIVDHPAFATWAWDVPALAARFAPGDPLPTEVRERIETHRNRSAAGRWLERAGVEASATWGRTVGRHLFGAAMYVLFPLNWAAFLVFGVAVAAGRRLVRSADWRVRGFVALAVLMLTPVMVPTFVGAVYMPHAFVQVFDFDPGYYLREPGFATLAASVTGLLAWWFARLVRRSRARGDGSSVREEAQQG